MRRGPGGTRKTAGPLTGGRVSATGTRADFSRNQTAIVVAAAAGFSRGWAQSAVASSSDFSRTGREFRLLLCVSIRHTMAGKRGWQYLPEHAQPRERPS